MSGVELSAAQEGVLRRAASGVFRCVGAAIKTGRILEANGLVARIGPAFMDVRATAAGRAWLAQKNAAK